ncbi:MAG: Asparagine synthetase 1 [Planctomycetota bacterium]
MCGIAGLISVAKKDPNGSHRTIVQRMCGDMIHRGPDADGFWSDEYAALGHRRLAIIDLTESGRQPMTNEDESLWITFNGEIYNFQDLRSELIKSGHRIRSHSDTEVILHAYEQWGEACVKRFRGMFAFAIWDKTNRRLFAARDRVGKKPFFYFHNGQEFRFASEIHALVSDKAIARDLNAQALDFYLTWGYVPAPMSPFSHVSKLLPGHTLSLDLNETGDSFKIQTNRYWDLPYLPKQTIDFKESCHMIRELLSEAVRLRMISDVPLGAFLSGGIDSSIIVGLMAQLSPKPVKTFSIGFREGQFNELDHARRIADRWGTEHHEFIVEPDAVDILPMLVRHYGEPYADSSAVPTYYVSQVTRKHVTVALNGDGGDEGFLGYERYLANGLAARIQNFPGATGSLLLLRHLIPDSTNSKSLLRRMRRFLNVVSMPEKDRYAHWIGYFGSDAKKQLYSKPFQNKIQMNQALDWYNELTASQPGLSAVERANLADIYSYLPYDLLVKVDIATMACSLEARSPLLDHEVLEFAATLPMSYKRRGQKGKFLLREAFSDLLPSENVNRRKAGFGVPIGDWFRGPMKAMLTDHIASSSSVIRTYLNGSYIDSLLDDHLKRRSDQTFRLWNLLMLELWHREFEASTFSS